VRQAIIGQFGVGFYSAFMVADKVTVVSRIAGPKEKGVVWESTGDGTFTVEEREKETRGTDVTLHLREDARDFLQEYTIRSIVKKFSDFIEHPVAMDVEKEKKKIEEEVLNSQKAIWLKNRTDITDKEYNEFYKHISRDFTDPAKVVHFSAEGASEFKALLFLPAKAPFSLFDTEHKIGIHLYVRRVFIMDDCKKLLPDYLRFIKGVVDSSDLPLNVSREILQETKEMERIKKGLVNKVLSTLKEMKEKEFQVYTAFFKEFGSVLKEGLNFDSENKDKIQDLLLYHTTNTEPDSPVSLKQYVDRMREGQKEIFYVIGENLDETKRSPFLEKFHGKGYEVILMTDPIDEWAQQWMLEYAGKKFKAINKGDMDIDEKTEKKEHKEQEGRYKDLMTLLAEKLPDVKEVRVSNRLSTSACCLVADEFAPGAHMEKFFKAMGQAVPQTKPVLELNPSHQLVKNLEALFRKDKGHALIAEYASLLYEQALLLDGKKLKDPIAFATKLNTLLSSELDLQIRN